LEVAMANRLSIHSTAGLVFCLLASFACHAALAAEPKRVMMLHSFGLNFKPWNEYAKFIRTELDQQSPWPLEIQDHSLVSARSSDEDPEGPFIEYLRALFANRPLDLIVSIGAPAADFVQRNRKQLFPTTPMVFTAVEQRVVQRTRLTENDAVVASHTDFAVFFETMLRVLPETRTVAIVNGDSSLERFWLAEMRQELEPLTSRLSLVWYNDLSFEEMLKRAASLPPRSAIFLAAAEC
jgi:hypothetical protein